MNKFNLDSFIRGWFIGGFEPSIIKTTDVEVAIQKFSKGQKESRHCHKVATEITAIVKGKVRMNDIELSEGEIISIEPGTFTDFEAIEESTTVVVKYPGALNDKYLENN